MKRRIKGVIMKRRITVEQLRELTEEQQQRLREWWIPKSQYGDMVISEHNINNQYAVFPAPKIPYAKEICLPLLSVGQMIELLQSYKDKDIFKYHDIDITDENLCDALWQAVKQVL